MEATNKACRDGLGVGGLGFRCFGAQAFRVFSGFRMWGFTMQRFA